MATAAPPASPQRVPAREDGEAGATPPRSPVKPWAYVPLALDQVGRGAG